MSSNTETTAFENLYRKCLFAEINDVIWKVWHDALCLKFYIKTIDSDSPGTKSHNFIVFCLFHFDSNQNRGSIEKKRN